MQEQAVSRQRSYAANKHDPEAPVYLHQTGLLLDLVVALQELAGAEGKRSVLPMDSDGAECCALLTLYM